MSIRNHLEPRFSGLLCVVSSIAGLAGAIACGSESGGSTTGKRITLHAVMIAEPVARSTFTTGFGWDVTLTKAAVAITGLYYFDGTPPTALFKAPRRSMRSRLSSLLVATAWAHPGHYQSGTALGETLFREPTALDLFAASPRQLPDGDGVTGIYRSARFVIPEKSPADAVLGGHIAIAEGKAINHDEPSSAPIYFRLIADYDDVSMNVNGGAVDGCILDETTVTSDGTITLEIKPTIWLNLVDFARIDAGVEAAPTEAHDAGFSQGVTQLSAYHFSYSE
jgi:hypothetical protein